MPVQKRAASGDLSNFHQPTEFADYSLSSLFMMGTIKTMTDKGFGFIAPEGGDKDLFFHSSALVGVTFTELAVEDKVTFDIEQSDKGPRAANVSRA